MNTENTPQPPQLVKDDPWLEPQTEAIQARIHRFNHLKETLEYRYKSLYELAGAHEYYGFHYDKKKKGWYYREWAPAAASMHLIGDFNDWNRESHAMYRIDNGNWEVFVADGADGPLIAHKQKVKVMVGTETGEKVDRIPLYIQRVWQDPETYDFVGQIWHPEKEFKWGKDSFDLSKLDNPLIYEVHVGMALEKEGVGTWKEFEKEVLPRIAKLGYTCIQMMAVQEHPYYGSFGYHVSNFFAASSRFGTPEDLKSLIKAAHKQGIGVIMDIVHSHAVKNINDGINNFDGTVHQFFHEGSRGEHPDWDSKLFNYGKWEVVEFLLSNIRYWLEEYHFDGFRFDGVTSMMYTHHGHIGFDHYEKYFDGGVDNDAIVYLQLANHLAHEIKPGCVSIAEDVSGMPGIGKSIEDGGLGFDFRLAMGIPDYWIKILRDKRDEDWNVWEIYHTMLNRRFGEKHISYCESHDQALVGDKTIAFWLMDQEMYWHMQKDDDNIVIDRGIALHKMIRFVTLSLGGEGYLTFIGNEFGHPEWVDFPRTGNDWSFRYARRQWNLVDNEDLKYKYLSAFDQKMIETAKKHGILENGEVKMLNADTDNNTMIFSKNELVFVFNFHPTHAIPNYEFWVGEGAEYEIILDSDAEEFGGHGRLDHSISFKPNENGIISIYNPNRTVQVLKRKKNSSKKKKSD